MYLEQIQKLKKDRYDLIQAYGPCEATKRIDVELEKLQQCLEEVCAQTERVEIKYAQPTGKNPFISDNYSNLDDHNDLKNIETVMIVGLNISDNFSELDVQTQLHIKQEIGSSIFDKLGKEPHHTELYCFFDCGWKLYAYIYTINTY